MRELLRSYGHVGALDLMPLGRCSRAPWAVLSCPLGGALVPFGRCFAPRLGPLPCFTTRLDLQGDIQVCLAMVPSAEQVLEIRAKVGHEEPGHSHFCKLANMDQFMCEKG